MGSWERTTKDQREFDVGFLLALNSHLPSKGRSILLHLSLPPSPPMDLVATQIAQIQEQARLQAASIASLASTVAHLSSENARLSSENENLKSRIEDQELSFSELSKFVAPEGHWVRKGGARRREESEEGEEGGQWLWSLVRLSFLLDPKGHIAMI